MKKFLFTLVGLLMAGSAFAGEYMYFDDIVVPDSIMQQTSNKKRQMIVPMHAQFDRYVSAWQMWIYPPEGVTVYAVTTGDDYPLTYADAMDNETTFVPGFSWQGENNTGIAAVLLEQGYYYPEGSDPDEDDPVCYGNPKWLGYYDNYLQVTLRFAADFTGGEITVHSEPSSSDDPRGDICLGVPADFSDHSAMISLEEHGQDKVADPVVSFVENGDVLTVTWTCETEGAELFIDGVSYGTMPYSYTVNRTYEDQVIAGTAVAKKADMEDSNEVPFSYTFVAKEKQPADAPVITMEVFDTYVVITATGDGEIFLSVGEQEAEGNGSASVTIDRTYEDVNVTAYAKAYGDPETQTESPLASKDFTVPAMNKPVATTPTINFVPTMNGEEVVSVEVVVENATEYHIWVNGDQLRGEVIYASYNEVKNIHVEATNAPGDPYIASNNQADYTLGKLNQIPSQAATFRTEMDDDYVYVYADGPGVILYDEYGQEVDPQPYAIARAEYDPEGSAHNYVGVSAKTQEEGEQYAPTTTYYTVDVPMKDEPAPQYIEVAAPIITTSMDASNVYVTIEWPTSTGEHVYTGQYTYARPEFSTPDESYEVEAYVLADGLYLESAHATKTIVVPAKEYDPENPPTAINEMNAGKNIANVRYFNMAGQEMKEANGMTIIVTTYTDGTSSAVKVMK